MGLFDAIGNVVAAGVDVAIRTPVGILSDVADPFKERSDTIEAIKDAMPMMKMAPSFGSSFMAQSQLDEKALALSMKNSIIQATSKTIVNDVCSFLDAIQNDTDILEARPGDEAHEIEVEKAIQRITENAQLITTIMHDYRKKRQLML